MNGVGAWIRYGGPISFRELDFAAKHYRSAILQPWEVMAATELKRRRPDMTVLCYKCLSSTRDYEPGPIYSSGIAHREAEDAGGEWFATRLDGSRIEWKGYPGHWQMNVLNSNYHDRWVRNVTAELENSPFDGVMADNDVFDDYYGLRLPIAGLSTLQELRGGLDQLVHAAGAALNRRGKLLVPNISEARREMGRWASHSAYGGGFEEVWLGYCSESLFDPQTAEAQLVEAAGPGHSILRVPTNGDDTHPNFTYGLAAFWIFGGGKGSFSATGHDDYSRTPHIVELDWSLGAPKEDAQGDGFVWSREFTQGWAAVNLNQESHSKRLVDVPRGMMTVLGTVAPTRVAIPARTGVIFLRAG